MSIMYDFIYNLYYLRVERILILMAIVYSFTIYKNKIYDMGNEYILNNELSKGLKRFLCMIFMGIVIKYLDIKLIGLLIGKFNWIIIVNIYVVLAVMLLLDRLLFYKVSNSRAFKNKYIRYLISINYLFVIIVVARGVEGIILSGGIQMLLLTLKIYFESSNEEDARVNKIDLYKSRRKHLDHIMEIITQFNDDNFAISINGEWGSGKSVIIKELVDECTVKGHFNIYIKPLISDSTEKLLVQFRSGMEKILLKNGIPCGEHSSLSKYIKEINKIISFNSKFTLADIFELNEDKVEFTSYKEDLQKDINNLLEVSNKKIIVIIDDFDRIEEERQKNILAFISEVIDFNGVTIVIAFDNIKLKNNQVINIEYMEKFVASQVHINKVEFEEIIKFHSKEILCKKEFENTICYEIVKELEENISRYWEEYTSCLYRDLEYMKEQNLEGDAKEKNRKKCMELSIRLEEKLSGIDNPRKVKCFLNEIKNTMFKIQKYYSSFEYAEEMLKQANASKVIYIINFIKVFYKSDFEFLIARRGLEEVILSKLNENVDLDIMFWKNIYLLMYDEGAYRKLKFGEGLFCNEEVDRNRRNTNYFIKDIFIYNNLSEEDIDIKTPTEKIFAKIENSNYLKIDGISDMDDYQKIVFRNSKNEEVKLKRFKTIFKSWIDNNHHYNEFINESILLMDSIDIAESIIYKVMYIQMIKEYIYEKENLYTPLENICSDMLESAKLNLSRYYNQYITAFVNMKFKAYKYEVYNGEVSIISFIKQYIKKNDISIEINDNEDIFYVIDRIDELDYDTCSEEILNEIRVKISEFQKIIQDIQYIKDHYNSKKNLDYIMVVKNFNDVINNLKLLSKDGVIDYNKILIFHESLRYMNCYSKDKDIQRDYVKMITNIIEKIDKKRCSELQYLDIKVLVSKLIY
ncbi:MAG: P-loop NTPase fold protein [Peptostreptococcaceae bacterium]